MGTHNVLAKFNYKYIRFTILHHGLVRAVSLPPLGVDPGGGYFIPP